jgi:hypothetical protein
VKNEKITQLSQSSSMKKTGEDLMMGKSVVFLRLAIAKVDNYR